MTWVQIIWIPGFFYGITGNLFTSHFLTIEAQVFRYSFLTIPIQLFYDRFRQELRIILRLSKAMDKYLLFDILQACTESIPIPMFNGGASKQAPSEGFDEQ